MLYSGDYPWYAKPKLGNIYDCMALILLENLCIKYDSLTCLLKFPLHVFLYRKVWQKREIHVLNAVFYHTFLAFSFTCFQYECCYTFPLCHRRLLVHVQFSDWMHVFRYRMVRWHFDELAFQRTVMLSAWKYSKWN